MEVQTFADQLFFTTLRVEATDGIRSWGGTSFIYAVETEKGTAHFVVTNRHVLQDAKEATFFGIRGEEDKPLLGREANARLTPVHWQGHPDERVDVAAMPFSQVLNSMKERSLGMFFRSVSPTLCLTAENQQELDSLEDIIFVGYPSGIYDTVNLLPVIRRGSTATPIAVDYEGLPAFLVDASVFPGSSGSPVFLTESGVFRSRDGAVNIGGRGRCVGILAAVHERSVEGELVNIPTRLGVAIKEPIDLGIVYKSSTFDACVDPLLEAADLRRVDTREVATPAEPMLGDDEVTPADEQLAQAEGKTSEPESGRLQAP